MTIPDDDIDSIPGAGIARRRLRETVDQATWARAALYRHDVEGARNHIRNAKESLALAERALDGETAPEGTATQ